MRLRFKKWLLIIFVWPLTSWSANGATITIGSASLLGGNCLPFSCQGSHEYQQIYDGSAFGHRPIELSAVSFYVDPFSLTFGSNSLITPSFDISLSTTSKNIGPLDLNFGNNIGGDNTIVFSGPLSVANAEPGEELLLSFTSEFRYNPNLGNLLLTINSVDGFTPQNFTSNSLYLESENPSVISSRLTSTLFGIDQDSSALVTTFTFSAAPEPSTWAMLLIGFAGIGFAGYRRARLPSGL